MWHFSWLNLSDFVMWFWLVTNTSLWRVKVLSHRMRCIALRYVTPRLLTYVCFHLLSACAVTVFLNVALNFKWKRNISSLFVCVFVLLHDVSKIDAAMLLSPNLTLTYKCSWKYIYFWGKNVVGQGHELQKHCRRGSLHSCECWFLLVCFL